MDCLPLLAQVFDSDQDHPHIASENSLEYSIIWIFKKNAPLVERQLERSLACLEGGLA